MQASHSSSTSNKQSAARPFARLTGKPNKTIALVGQVETKRILGNHSGRMRNSLTQEVALAGATCRHCGRRPACRAGRVSAMAPGLAGTKRADKAARKRPHELAGARSPTFGSRSAQGRANSPTNPIVRPGARETQSR